MFLLQGFDREGKTDHFHFDGEGSGSSRSSWLGLLRVIKAVKLLLIASSL
jgi:hypothetical protein